MVAVVLMLIAKLALELLNVVSVILVIIWICQPINAWPLATQQHL